MSMPPRFETARETAVISKILADLVRSVQLIEREIEAEEERDLRRRFMTRAPPAPAGI